MRMVERRKAIPAFCILIVFMLALAVWGLLPNKTQRLLAKEPIEKIRVHYLAPFDQDDFEYIITPDLHVAWNTFYIWDGTPNYSWEKYITQDQYDGIVAAIAGNDFIALPQELKPWNGADGMSQEIEIVVNGVSYRSGGYNPSETNRKFAHIWRALEDAKIIYSEDGYVPVYSK